MFYFIVKIILPLDNSYFLFTPPKLQYRDHEPLPDLTITTGNEVRDDFIKTIDLFSGHYRNI